MTFNELKEILDKYPFLVEQKYIFIDLNRFRNNEEKFSYFAFVFVKNLWGKILCLAKYRL